MKDDDNDARWMTSEGRWRVKYFFFKFFFIDNDFNNDVHGFSDDIQIYDQIF